MEVGKVGVECNGRSLVMESAAKRRRLGDEELKSSSCRPKISSSSSDSIGSIDDTWSCCSSNGSSVEAEEEESKLTDLKATVEILESEEDSPNISEVKPTERRREEVLDSTIEMAPRSPSPSSHVMSASPSLAKMPPKHQLEEFFAAAEKELQKRFKDRYNYDIVEDVPLKGRYDWVELKP